MMSYQLLGVVAAISVMLNVLFSINYYYYVDVGRNNRSSGDEVRLSWSRRAAAEAEAAASLNCSGHGRAYLDGLQLADGSPTCECHICYDGAHDCSQFNPLCDANADGGDPLFLEPFWMKHAESSAVLVAGWHRMGYSFQDMTTISKELERLIRILHQTLGNAITDGKFLLFGTGSTQLLAAALNALSHNSSSLAQVVASVPYYALYEMQVELLDSGESTFEGDPKNWKNNSDATVIEFVTSPNNPDGQMNEAIFNGSNVKTINDRAYYWPHFTAIPAPDDGDLSIFTISKLTGHAGSRFGWALVKDQEVYERMDMFMKLNSLGVSRDSQLRALKLLRVVLEDGGREIFDFGYNTMKKRWEMLRDTFSLSDRFTLQKIPPQYCSFFHKVREPTPAYAWVKCEKEEKMSCNEVMRSANITGREGSIFRAEDRYVRLSLIRSQDDFDTLIHHLRRLLYSPKGEDKFESY